MRISRGERVPSARLAEIHDGAIAEVDSEMLFSGRRAVMIGVPGAFTPVCTEKHLPNFVANAERLKAAGYGMIVCLTANDPWTTASWARMLDPGGKIRFLSDGNLEFSRKMGLTAFRTDLYLGERTERFLMLIDNGVIEKLTVEPLVEHLTVTRYEDLAF